MRKFILILLAVVASACGAEPVEYTNVGKDGDVKLDLLFTHDGMKVYRFVDAGRYVYFVDGRGRMGWTTSHYDAATKTTRVERHAVETVE